MTVKYSEQRPEQTGKPDTDAKISIKIAERNGQELMIIKEMPAAEPASDQAIEIPVALLPDLKRAIAAVEDNTDGEIEASSAEQSICFAHESEERFARILDFYHISWQYEPRTFALEWDKSGSPVSSFTPDFYLPEHDLYIELTTLKQSLVTKKNRKVRRLRELYPDINIKVLYASDYRKLIEKFAASGKWQE